MAQIVVMFIAGKVADKTSPSIVEAVGYAIVALVAFPLFWLVGTRDTALITVAMILGLGFASIPYAPVGTVLTQLFPVKVRYSAIARTPEGAPVVDAGGRYLMPGLIESHWHPGIYVCLAMKADCRPSVTPRASDVVKAIREAAQEAEAGEWVRGWGYDEHLMDGPGRPAGREAGGPGRLLRVGDHHRPRHEQRPPGSGRLPAAAHRRRADHALPAVAPMVGRALSSGLRGAIHGIGDRAVRQVLDLIAASSTAFV